jgi:RNA polymerase sigma factor (sigma-70 family)
VRAVGGDLFRLDNMTPSPPLQDDVSDSELVSLFAESPERAWLLFLERYSGLILSIVRGIGCQRDEAMDRFVYVCDKLREDGFRRLRTVRRLGEQGQLVPWLRVVVRNLCVNWAWSVQGRRRLLKPIARLSELDRRVFELHFWRGRTASEVHEQLRCTFCRSLSFREVFESLDRVASCLSGKARWRLTAALARRLPPVKLEDAERVNQLPVRSETPESALLRREAEQRLHEALGQLTARQRLILELRFEEALSTRGVAKVLALREAEVRAALRSGLEALRRALVSSDQR